VTVSAKAASLPVGQTTQLTATGLLSNGQTEDLTNAVVWSSSAPAVASVTASGMVTAMAPGTATVKATSGSVSGTFSEAVTASTSPPSTPPPPTPPPPTPPPVTPPPNGNLYIYQNGTGAGNNFTSVFGVDLSYSVTINGHDTTVPQLNYDMKIMGGGGWQPAANNFGGNNGYGVGPFGADTHAYTYLTIDLYPTDSTYPFDMQSHYVGSYSGTNGATDTTTPSWITDISRIVGPLTPNTWNKGLKIPLSALGQLGEWAQYKFFFREHTNSTAGVYYLDNVGFVPGSYSWIYDGGANNGGWNPGNGGQGQGNWGNDPATLLNGWTDASTGATVSYSQDPSGLPVAGSLNGVTQPGLNAVPTKVIAVSGLQTGGKWAVSHAGFETASYDHLTFALLPTAAGYTYTATVNGTSVNIAQYTFHDWGANSNMWTVYNIPLSAFGSPGSITSISIQDSATTGSFYITAPGFYK
jgi:hypothetical protein